MKIRLCHNVLSYAISTLDQVSISDETTSVCISSTLLQYLVPHLFLFLCPPCSQISWVNFIGIWAVRLTRYYNFYFILWRVIVKKNKILNAFSVLLFMKRGTNPVLLLDNPAEKHNLVFFVFPQ